MAIKYRLRSADGEDLGSFERFLSDWFVGMEFRASGNLLYRIEAIDGDTWKVAPVEPPQVSRETTHARGVQAVEKRLPLADSSLARQPVERTLRS